MRKIRRNVRPCWKFEFTGDSSSDDDELDFGDAGDDDELDFGDAGDEQHGVSASADRVSKRRRQGSPIDDATGGDAGDEQHGVSDSIDSTAAHEHSPYTIADLADHIKNYEENPKILDELGCCVESNDREILTLWFKELEKAWKVTMSPDQTITLVLRILEKVHDNEVLLADIEGFSAHYSLPAYYQVDSDSPEERIK